MCAIAAVLSALNFFRFRPRSDWIGGLVFDEEPIGNGKRRKRELILIKFETQDELRRRQPILSILSSQIQVFIYALRENPLRSSLSPFLFGSFPCNRKGDSWADKGTGIKQSYASMGGVSPMIE